MQIIDTLVIGAGPSGSLCSTLLHKQGIEVVVVERALFPRFSIGESLLPQSMVFLQNAGMMEAVTNGNFQLKNGAVFNCREQDNSFDFSQKFTSGPDTTFQVKRAHFDKQLADCATSNGVDIRYQQEVIDIEKKQQYDLITIRDKDNVIYKIGARFVLDASGFGRVLPKLFNLEIPSDFPVRQSIFSHVEDRISDISYDREKIVICVHPDNKDVWYWLIPFSDGTASVGIVAEPAFFEKYSGSNENVIKKCIFEQKLLQSLLKDAKFTSEVRKITGYSANVKSLFGDRYALLGNAGEFLDPIFSSGVTIALKSAELAANVLIRQNRGEDVCWQRDYATPLKRGIDTFKAFVESWYDGELQDVVLFKDNATSVKEMICSILAGYAWDEKNPYVSKTKRRLKILAEICKS